MGSFMKSLSIKVSAPILVAIPVIAAVAAISFLAFSFGQETANDLASQNVAQIHGRIEDRLEALLTTTRRVNDQTLEMLKTGKLDGSDMRSWESTMVSQKQLFNEVSGIMYGTQEGDVVWMYRYPEQANNQFAYRDSETDGKVLQFDVTDDGERSNDPEKMDFDPRGRPWYKEAMETRVARWGAPYKWTYGTDEEPKYTLGVPYHRVYFDEDKSPLGVIQTELSLYDLSRFLETLEVGETGIAFILDSEGQLVSNSAGAATAGGEEARIAGASSENGQVSSASQHLLDKFDGKLTGIEGDYQDVIQINGAPHVLEVSTFEHGDGLQWLIVTLIPESDFMAAVEQGWRQSIIYGLIAVLAALAFGVFLAMRMVKPLVALVDDVRRIGGGDLEHQVEIDDTPEFDLLSNELNTMTADLREGEKMKHALELASEVQTSLLPSAQPELPALDITGHSTYCDETGGDYYDFLDVSKIADNTVALALGDVMGHGAAAAMLMATARGILRSRSRHQGSLAEMLMHMNDLLHEDTGGERFMTMILMVVDAETMSGFWASAGHDPPIIYDPRDDSFNEWDAGGLPLGIMEGADYEEMTFDNLCSGQIFLIATDGLWEGHNAQGEMIGKERLCDTIRANADKSADEIGEALKKCLDDFLDGEPHHDDVTFVLAKIR